MALILKVLMPPLIHVVLVPLPTMVLNMKSMSNVE